jgi:class 3 adenylate cyclase
MKVGRCSLIFEDHFHALSIDDTFIPVHATLLGMTKESEVKSFVLILRDETLLQSQMKEAETAQTRSEELLYSILPRDIVIRINQGEMNISFSVPSVTVVFLDIVKFSQYRSIVSPTQTMETLSTIFAKFDSICEKYSLITKIKLIGDIYMAAGGIFNPNDDPSLHAKDVVQFSLECLSAIEDINTLLNAQLQLRIGVNTGGPLIAGVFGTDKTTFDIMGDAINVASRIQSTDIPNLIQISKNTYDLISDMDFNIEYRGEVALKGKGKQKTYLVKPLTIHSILASFDGKNAISN